MRKIRRTLKYGWYWYIVVAVLSFFLWQTAFHLFHMPANHQRLTLFFAGTVENYSFEEETVRHFAENGVKAAEISSCSPDDAVFFSKYNVVGLNACDAVLVPLSVAEQTQCNLTFLQPSDDFGCDFFTQNGKNFGWMLPEKSREALAKYFRFTGEPYVLMVAESSVNAGPLTENALLLAEWMCRYEMV